MHGKMLVENTIQNCYLHTFSPVAGERFLIKKGYNRKFVIEKLLVALEDLKKFYKVSSAHINFINSHN